VYVLLLLGERPDKQDDAVAIDETNLRSRKQPKFELFFSGYFLFHSKMGTFFFWVQRISVEFFYYFIFFTKKLEGQNIIR
jgi:hypothetical protein